MEKEKVFYNWDEFFHDIIKLYKLIQNETNVSKDVIIELDKKKPNICNIVPKSTKFKVLYAIPRGGVLGGVLLSYLLKIKLKTTLNDLLEYTKQNNIKFKNVLVFDDIIDSGKTLNEIKEEIPKCYYVTLFQNEECDYNPDCTANIINNKKWIVFPWEDENSKTEKDNTCV